MDDILQADPVTVPIVKNARLVAVPKPNGKARPICIGESLRRFALGALHTKMKPKFEALLRPHQFGLSLDGTTKAVNEIGTYLEAHPKSIMLILDFKNAFNSVLRAKIREALREKLPQLLPLFESFYSEDTEVACWTNDGWQKVAMPRGVIQGDPFSMALFCLAVMPLLREAIKLMEAPAYDSSVEGIVKAYADDWHPVGSAEKIRRIFPYLYRRAPLYGMEMQPEKCSWFSPDIGASPNLNFEPNTICPGSPAISLPRMQHPEYVPPTESEGESIAATCTNQIPMEDFERYYKYQAEQYKKEGVSCGSARVLGSFLGDPQAVLLQLLAKIREFVSELRRLHIMDGLTQEQITLLRESYNSRFDHLARTINPEVLAPAAFWYDHFINKMLASVIKEPINYKIRQDGCPPEYGSYDSYLQLLRRKPGDGGIGITPLHTKLHSCFAGATGRATTAWRKKIPKWLPHNWVELPRFAVAQASFERLCEGLMDLDLSHLPEKVAETVSKRQGTLKKSLKKRGSPVDGGYETQEVETNEVMPSVEEDAVAEKEDVVPQLFAIAGNNTKLQSQLTTVERFVSNTDLLTSMYGDESPEAQALQALNLSAATSTATLPLMVRPTHESYMTEADVFVDLVRMQAALPLIDADMAVAECGKCNKAVDRLGYHAAFCSSTRTYIHDAVVNELRDCLSSAGACVLHEPINVLPHTHSLDKTAQQLQGEVFRPDLQVTHLDDSGKRYLIDVTTVDVSCKTYRSEASKIPGAAASKAEARKTREYRSKADGKMTVVLPAAIELSGRWGDGMVLVFKMAVRLATKLGKNHSGQFANRWKRRISIAARRGMMYQAHYALRKHLRYSLHNRDDVMEDDDDDTHMQEL